VEQKNTNEKISDQMQTLADWWSQIDPEKRNFVPLVELKNFLRKNQVIGRDSEVYRLIKQTIPTEVVTEDCVKQSQFMKIFARACLRGAIMNIYENMKKVMKHE